MQRKHIIYTIHPILFALYPVLFLWVDNIDQTPFFAILRSLILSVSFAVVVFVISGLILRNINKTAIVTSLTILCTLTFGHVYNYLESLPSLNIIIGYFRLLAIFLILFVISIVTILRYKGDLATLNQTLLVISLLLVITTIGRGVIFVINGNSAISPFERTQPAEKQNDSLYDFPDRDVYYIILDSYGREDLLKYHFNYDNSSFIQELEDLGFVIPDCTQSNYDNTVNSMTSSLNMDYLPELLNQFNESATEIDYRELSQYIRQSLVRQKFESLGYQTASFKTVYPFLDIKDSDFYYDLEQADDFYNKLESENFQYLFLNTTILRVAIEILETSPDYLFEENATPTQVFLAKILTPQRKLFSNRHFKWYRQHLYAFEQLEKIPDIPGNKFVYAHLFMTHQPFVFTSTGQVRWPVTESDRAYLDQITYTNSRMIKIIKTIIEVSTNPPVIILQGDHSYVQGEDRNKVLNAYYLPEGGSEMVTPVFSPVNTFRLIFNTYYGEDFKILPNIAYRPREGSPYQFEPLPESCVSETIQP